jgi:superfamily II DNA or RNA helicase
VAPTLLVQRSGNLVDVSPNGYDPLPDEARRLLEPLLTYQKKKFNYGVDRYNRTTGAYDRMVDICYKKCYTYDTFGRLVTRLALAERLLVAAAAAGYDVDCRDLEAQLEPRPRPNCYDCDLSLLTPHFQFRARQEECLQAMLDNEFGVVHAVTGFGKLVMLAMHVLVHPKAKYMITTRRGPLVNKIARFLSKYIPNVAQIGAADGRNDRPSRVTVYTAASLHHAELDSDFVIADEAHELMADESSSVLARFNRARMFGLSASPTGRLDGTDMRLESLFGKTIFHIPYPEAVELGLVSPIRVEWVDVPLSYNPAAGLKDVRRKRAAVWANAERNRTIATSALDFGPDEQVLIAVDTVEHGVNLWHLLREHGYAFIYNKMKKDDLKRYIRDGLLPADYRPLTFEEREHARVAFEAGLLKKAISTVWDVGIDPVHLAAVVRAEGNNSGIEDIQVTGRVSRTAGGKRVGIVRDFLDSFDQGYAERARQRKRRYADMGWEQVTVRPTDRSSTRSKP